MACQFDFLEWRTDAACSYCCTPPAYGRRFHQGFEGYLISFWQCHQVQTSFAPGDCCCCYSWKCALCSMLYCAIAAQHSPAAFVVSCRLPKSSTAVGWLVSQIAGSTCSTDRMTVHNGVPSRSFHGQPIVHVLIDARYCLLASPAALRLLLCVLPRCCNTPLRAPQCRLLSQNSSDTLSALNPAVV